MFLWFATAEMEKFKRDYNVERKISTFANFFEKCGGGAHTLKLTKHVRGMCINVAAFPLQLLRLTFTLVNIFTIVWLSTYSF